MNGGRAALTGKGVAEIPGPACVSVGRAITVGERPQSALGRSPGAGAIAKREARLRVHQLGTARVCAALQRERIDRGGRTPEQAVSELLRLIEVPDTRMSRQHSVSPTLDKEKV